MRAATTSANNATANPPATARAGATASGVYGDPEAAAKHWVQQSLEDTCGLASVADVVGEVTGNAPTEKRIITLAQYLGADRKVIAWVNGGTILGTNDQRTTADHLLVVTGIDTDNDTVHLNDPYADNGDTKVSIGTFMTAWKTGQESIVVTAPAG